MICRQLKLLNVVSANGWCQQALRWYALGGCGLNEQAVKRQEATLHVSAKYIHLHTHPRVHRLEQHLRGKWPCCTLQPELIVTCTSETVTCAVSKHHQSGLGVRTRPTSCALSGPLLPSTSPLPRDQSTPLLLTARPAETERWPEGSSQGASCPGWGGLTWAEAQDAPTSGFFPRLGSIGSAKSRPGKCQSWSKGGSSPTEPELGCTQSASVSLVLRPEYHKNQRCSESPR